MWLEEPVPAENVDAYKRIAQDDQHADLCRREPTTSRTASAKLLETGAVDIVMPDLQKVGGLGEGQRIANLANLYYVAVCAAHGGVVPRRDGRRARLRRGARTS